MVRTIIKNIFVSLVVLLSCISVHGQVPEIFRPSLTANARAVQRYADIPVSLYTGTPDITIPLDTLREFRMSLPITLSYHCGGVKVAEHPGWTGLGWTLALGGVITREEQGQMDEYDKEYEPWGTKRGFLYCHKCVEEKFKDGWEEGSKFESKLLINNSFNCDMLDMTPDVFHFSFNGITGFFVMDVDGTWNVYSNRHIKVLNVETQATQKPMNVELIYNMAVITNITLQDDNGIRYEFGGTDAMDMTINIKCQSTSQWIPTAWYLKKMVHPDGKEINFSYERGPYTVNMSFNNNFSIIRYGNQIYQNTQNIGSQYAGQLLTPVYLKKVKGETFTIDLYNSESNELNYSDSDYSNLLKAEPYNQSDDYDPFRYLGEPGVNKVWNEMMGLFKWRQLDSVVVTGETGNRLKKVSMAYSSNSSQRLTLNSVSIHGTDGKVGYRYLFDYTNVDKMPDYLSADRDAWGFYKSSDSVEVNVPGHSFINPSTMSYGSLKEITWPTGGKTQFEFEPHTYSRQLPLNGWGDIENTNTFVAGGLRVKSITDVPADGSQPRTRRYLYVSGYNGNSSAAVASGILEGHALYFYAGGDGMLTYGESSTSSLLPCSNSLGHIVCYPEAVELSPTGGWTIYKFTSLLDKDYQNEQPVNAGFNDKNMPELKFTSKAHYRGLPVQETIYNADGIKVAITNYSYSPLQDKKVFSRCLDFTWERYIGKGGSIFDTKYSFYKVYTHRLVETSCTKHYFGSNTSSINSSVTSEYSYNEMGQVCQYCESCYDGCKTNRRQSNIHYAWEVDNTGFKATNELNYVLSEQNRVNGHIVDSLTNTYGIGCDDRVSKQKYLTQKKYVAGEKQSLNPIYECLRADTIGYPILVRDSKSIPTVYLWHSDRLCPLAIIQNATYDEVKGKLGCDPVSVNEYTPDIHDKINALRTTLPDAFVTSCTYVPHIGITNVTDPSGKTETYEYDNMLRLCSIRDNNGSKVAEATFSTATTEK